MHLNMLLYCIPRLSATWTTQNQIFLQLAPQRRARAPRRQRPPQHEHRRRPRQDLQLWPLHRHEVVESKALEVGRGWEAWEIRCGLEFKKAPKQFKTLLELSEVTKKARLEVTTTRVQRSPSLFRWARGLSL